MSSIRPRRPDTLPLGFERDAEGGLVELSLRAYEGLAPEDVVRHALEEGVGARQTLQVLHAMGVHGATLAQVIEARAIARAELADEYAVSKVEARALLLRQADKILARLNHEMAGGNYRVAKDVLTALALRARLVGLDKGEDSLAEKLSEELARVNDASRAGGLSVPRSTATRAETLEAAMKKHQQHQFDEGGKDGA